MKVDTQPFPNVNMVEGYDRSTCRQLDFTLGINMAGHTSRQQSRRQEADSCDRPQKEERDYITEEQVRHVRNQRPVSSHLLRKYQYQYQQRLQHETEEEEYERRTGKRLRRREDTRGHWNCPFFMYCWDSGMKRLPTLEDCPECNSQKKDTRSASVFQCLGPGHSRREQVETPRTDPEDEEDRCHRPRWCPDGLNRSQKRRVQRLRSLEEAEAQYLKTLRKARPDLAEKKVWQPKKSKADMNTSADAHMVFVLPAEFHAPGREEVPVAQLDLGPRPVIFEKPREKNYRHLKALYLRGYINSQPVSRMLVDTGAAVNIMPYSVLRKLGHSVRNLIKTNITLSDFNGQTSEAEGVLSVDLTVGGKTVPTSFFVVNSKGSYTVLLGRDWIHANCCIPSMMHQCLIQWDGDEVEVVHADDSAEVSHATMSVWDAEDQEPISGISLEGCDRVEATKNGVRLVLSTGLTE
ncbi:hypothetical protein GQ55_2G145500 [Panicum hallii var. hallii]|uniref:Peptidase A2 domain-containing protein n=1 Tax=Panicum hallii var. hallii TaxID=1504633 RepID=A0A2T7EPR3_9POAL|nr:hypothetical protein GQ55_2G145500 [Panicum hallii var. hallii]